MGAALRVGLMKGGQLGGGVYMCGAGLRMGGDSGVRMRDFLGGGEGAIQSGFWGEIKGIWGLSEGWAWRSLGGGGGLIQTGFARPFGGKLRQFGGLFGGGGAPGVGCLVLY